MSSHSYRGRDIKAMSSLSFVDMCKMWHTFPNINPLTGRSIATGKATYMKLASQCPSKHTKTRKTPNPKLINNNTKIETKVSKTSDAPADKYCRCLMHVRPKQGNPYGICNAILKKNSSNMKQPRCVYKFSDYKKCELLAYAREKKLNVDKFMSKSNVVQLLENYQKQRVK